MSQKSTKKIPLATFADLAAQYHHRLLSLEAELKQKARAGELSTHGFIKRVKKLKQIQQELNKLQRLCLAEAPGKLNQTDIGLPILEDCTPLELSICEQFLTEREAEVLRLEQESGLIYRWIYEAVSGRIGTIKSTLRLSKLRHLISRYEKKTDLLQDESKKLALQIEKLLSNVNSSERQMGRNTLDGLMTLFHKLDETISRIARLRTIVKTEENKITQMESWLKREEATIKESTPYTSPPTPLATSRATEEANITLNIHMNKLKRRHKLVERFWDEMIKTEALKHLSPDWVDPTSEAEKNYSKSSLELTTSKRKMSKDQFHKRQRVL